MTEKVKSLAGIGSRIASEEETFLLSILTGLSQYSVSFEAIQEYCLKKEIKLHLMI